MIKNNIDEIKTYIITIGLFAIREKQLFKITSTTLGCVSIK